MPAILVSTIVAFFSGSLPFAVWIGHLLLKKDITAYGDANPGATNVLRAGGTGIGALALLLDTLKALIPVGMTYYSFGLTSWGIVPIAIAPVAGHAFSPFLGFHGGKAVATTLGVWMALTIWEGPTVGGVSLWLFTRLVGSNGWAVVFASVSMLTYLLLAPPAWNLLGVRPPPGIILAVWTGNMAIVFYKHREDLSHPPTLRSRRRKQPAA